MSLYQDLQSSGQFRVQLQATASAFAIEHDALASFVGQSSRKTKRLGTRISKIFGMEDQLDLVIFSAIHVTEGVNGNRDVFLRDELLGSWQTALHKPINVGHDRNRIVGHIFDAYLSDSKGERYADKDASDAKGLLSIATDSVIYANIFPDIAMEVLDSARINQKDEEDESEVPLDFLRALIGSPARLAVSMEAAFKDFDVRFRGEIIQGTEASDEMIRSLMGFGGTGVWEGENIERVLRGISWVGQALTDKPANPTSQILDAVDPRKLKSNSMVKIQESLNTLLGILTIEKTETETNQQSGDVQSGDITMADQKGKIPKEQPEQVAVAESAEVEAPEAPEAPETPEATETPEPVVQAKASVSEPTSQDETKGETKGESIDLQKQVKEMQEQIQVLKTQFDDAQSRATLLEKELQKKVSAEQAETRMVCLSDHFLFEPDEVQALAAKIAAFSEAEWEETFSFCMLLREGALRKASAEIDAERDESESSSKEAEAKQVEKTVKTAIATAQRTVNPKAFSVPEAPKPSLVDSFKESFSALGL